MVRRGRSHGRARLSFWVHQGLEYGFAVLVAGLGLHLGGLTEAALVGAGTLLLLASLVTRGPLGAFRLLSPAAHRLVDWLVATGLFVVPLVRLPHFDILSAALLWLVAASLVQLARGTRYATPGAKGTAVVPAGGRAATSASGDGLALRDIAPAAADADADVAAVATVAVFGDAEPAAATAGSPGAGQPASGGLLLPLARLAGRALGASSRRGRSG